MKNYIYICTALIALVFSPSLALAANPFLQGDVIVVANNHLELDITMEMLDEDDDSSEDITHVIELPVQEMHRERVRNQHRIRQGGDSSPTNQDQGSPAAIQEEIMAEIMEARQEAEEAKQGAINDGTSGQQKRGQ